MFEALVHGGGVTREESGFFTRLAEGLAASGEATLTELQATVPSTASLSTTSSLRHTCRCEGFLVESSPRQCRDSQRNHETNPIRRGQAEIYYDEPAEQCAYTVSDDRDKQHSTAYFS